MVTTAPAPTYKVESLPPDLVPNARYFVLAPGDSYFRLYLVNSTGSTAREIAGTPGEQGVPGPEGPRGPTGLSTYELAVNNGFVGTQAEWLASLVGPAGPEGDGDNNASLTSLSALGTAADRVAYTTGVDTWAETPLTSFARTLLDDADAGTARSTLGLGTMATETASNYLTTAAASAGYQPLDSDLTAIAALSTTTFGRSLLTQVDTSAARTTLGLAIGTDVQAQDAELAAIAGLTSAADRVPYFTGSGTAALATFTAFGRSLVDDADAATARGTIGLATSTTAGRLPLFTGTTGEQGQTTGLFEDSSGNVGVGTTSVIYSGLQVGAGGSGGAKHLVINGGDGTNGGSAFLFGANDIAPFPTAIGHYSAIYGGAVNRALTFYTGDNVLIPSGNVGIGTTSPLSRLHVKASASSTSVARYTTDDFALGSSGSELRIDFGATSGNTYSELRAFSNGEGALNDLILQSGGGNIGIGTISPSAKLDVNADTTRLRSTRTPASAAAAGNQGDWCYDTNYIYVCTATNTWKRAALATW